MKIELDVNINVPGVTTILKELAEIRLSQADLRRGIATLILKGKDMEQITQDIKQVAQDLATALTPLPAAIDAFEARITALLNNSGMSAEDKAELQNARDALLASLSAVRAVVTDATDGVDEGATPPTP